MFRMCRMAPLAAAVFALVVAGIGASQAQAGFLATLKSITLEGDGNYRWVYDVNLDDNTTIHKGDFFTIYDFDGYIGGTNTQPANWLFSTAMTGKTADKTVPEDHPGKPNLTWTYNGETALTGPLIISKDFTAKSSFQWEGIGDFGSKTHRTDNGKVVANISPIEVPVPKAPEPATLLLLGMGLPMLAVRLIRRRKALLA